MTLVARVRLSTGDVSYSSSNMVVLLLSGLSLSALYAITAGPLCVHLSALCCRTFDSDSPNSTAKSQSVARRSHFRKALSEQGHARRGGSFKIVNFGVEV